MPRVGLPLLGRPNDGVVLDPQIQALQDSYLRHNHNDITPATIGLQRRGTIRNPVQITPLEINDLVCGEPDGIRLNDAVYIEDSSLVYLLVESHTPTGTNNQNVGDTVNHQQMAQAIQFSKRRRINRIVVSLGETGHAGGSPGTVAVGLYTDDGGEPSTTLAWTGAEASLAQYGNLPSSGFANINFDITRGWMEANTTYWIKIRQTAVGSDPYINASQYLRVKQQDGTDSYPDGDAYEDVNGTWTAYNRDQTFLLYDQTVEGYLYKAKATDAAYYYAIGFAKVDVDFLETVDVKLGPIVGQFSGLSKGQPYYLSDTDGSISTSAGTNTIIMGVAKGAEQLQMNIKYP